MRRSTPASHASNINVSFGALAALAFGALSLGAGCAVATGDGTAETSAALTGTPAADAPSTVASTERATSKAAPSPAEEPATTLQADQVSPPDEGAEAGACEEPGRYTLQGGTVLDSRTGLSWQRTVNGDQFSQANARAFCEGLTIDGQEGFRLPTVQELQALLLKPAGLKGGPDACIPAIDQSAFPATPAYEFWSTTMTNPGFDENGLYTGFDDGRTHPADPTTPFYIRCVRDAAPSQG